MRKIIPSLFAAVLASVVSLAPVAAQQTGIPISQLPQAVTPLAGTETIPIVQNGFTRQVKVANLPGCSILGCTTTSLTPHAVLLGNGPNVVHLATVGAGGRLLLDQGPNADPLFVIMSGDGTLAANGTFTLTANKTIRVFNGVMQWLNSTYSVAIMSMDDIGDLTIVGNFKAVSGQFTGLNTAGVVINDPTGKLGTETAITPAQCPAATTNAQGCVEPDGTTVIISNGKLTAVGASASSIDAGGAITGITTGTAGGILSDVGGFVKAGAAIAPGNIVIGGGTAGPGDSNVALSSLATLADPTFTGVPKTPTAALGTNTTQLASGAFVLANGTPIYSAGGTQQSGGHIVIGSTNANASGAIVNFSGNATFTSSSTYHCAFTSENGSGVNNTGAYVSYFKNSGSQIQVYFSAAVSSVGYVCAGW